MSENNNKEKVTGLVGPKIQETTRQAVRKTVDNVVDDLVKRSFDADDVRGDVLEGLGQAYRDFRDRK